MRIHISNHFDLCVTRAALHWLHISAVELQLICDAWIAETVKNNRWQVVIVNEFLKGSVNDLPLNRSTTGRCKHHIKISVLISEQLFEIVYFFTCFTSISATVLGKNTFLTLVFVFGSFNTNAVWLLERAGGNLNTTPFSFNYSRASQLTLWSSLLTKI